MDSSAEEDQVPAQLSAPAQEPAEKKESFWASFTAADMRNLIVTVAGTVIGGILLVMVVALAVIVTRTWIPPVPSLTAAILDLVVTVVGLVVWGLGLLLATKRIRDRSPARVGYVVLVIMSSTFIAVVVLAWLGKAAGVK